MPWLPLIESSNLIDFKGYEEKSDYQNKSDEKTAVFIGVGRINSMTILFACMNPYFMMCSMGSPL